MLAVLLLVAVVPAARADDKADLKALAGKWEVAKVEIEGKDTTGSFKDVVLMIEGDQYSVTFGTMTDKGTIKLDSAKKPKQMDITGAEGPNRGKTFLSLYELKDDTLTVCYGLDFKTRPTDLKTAEKSNTMLISYKRKK
jgi:uncharacterized protein (TIGR03067 family)